MIGKRKRSGPKRENKIKEERSRKSNSLEAKSEIFNFTSSRGEYNFKIQRVMGLREPFMIVLITIHKNTQSTTKLTNIRNL
jgi:hypothetical protein